MKKKKLLAHHKSGSLSRLKRRFPNVTRIMDAEYSARVTVTREDNAHSAVRNHLTCSFALASKRCLEADGAMVGLSTTWLIHGNTGVRYLNPQSVSREITSFDRNAGFDEGDYLLCAPPESSRLGAVRSRNPRRSGRNRGILKFRHITRNVRASLMVA